MSDRPTIEYHDIRVRTENPTMLDKTVQQLGPAVVIDGSWDGDLCIVRVFGPSDYIEFAITNQGYGIIVKGDDDERLHPRAASSYEQQFIASSPLPIHSDDFQLWDAVAAKEQGARERRIQGKVSSLLPEKGQRMSTICLLTMHNVCGGCECPCHDKETT